MKTFKEFVKKPPIKWIGWEGSSFAEIRHHIVNEAFYDDETFSANSKQIDPVHFDPEILAFHHDDPLTPAEEHAVHCYTSGPAIETKSNGLSDLTGQPFRPEYVKFYRPYGAFLLNKILSHDYEGVIPEDIEALKDPYEFFKVQQHSKLLMDSIRPKRTNKQFIHLYSGIPYAAGRQFLHDREGTEYYLNKFISSSTSKNVATKFAIAHPKANPNETHVICFEAPSNSGMSVVRHSRFDENEVMIPPGTHMTYHGHTPETKYGQITYTHHVVIDPSKRVPSSFVIQRIYPPR